MMLILWQFFKMIISPTYLISCQHAEKRNIEKLQTFIAVAQKLKEL